MDEQQTMIEASASSISRRRFFGYAGAIAGAGLLMSGVASCKKDDDNGPTGDVDLGTGDIGILNYAYALEQLEAAFYIQATASPYIGITPTEQGYLNDLRNHEVAHREFFKKVLGLKAIQDLTPNFTSINFSDRTSVLTTARAFEDLGVSAYNGAGRLLSKTPEGLVYLGLAGKIVSVEARHAAIIREMLVPNSFADVSILNPVTRIDLARTPAEVVYIAGKYIYERLIASNLPNV